MIFHPHDPLTTPEDRTALRRFFVVLGALLLLLALQGLARAEQDNERPVASLSYAYAPKGQGRVLGGRPAGCPALWCACWLKKYLGIDDPKKNLNLARNWAEDKRFRRVAGPAPGVIALYRRGKKGGHIGIVTAVPRPGAIVLLSGNDDGAVRERERSTAGLIAYLQYVGS